MSHAGTYPPAPWRIAGPAAICAAAVPFETARALVPGDVDVVQVAPGRTLGGFLLARYEEGSTLRYGELLVTPALTRCRGRLGWWISHAYVDSKQSLAGGRRMWGVPKDLATFTWRDGDGGATVVREDGVPVLGAAWRPPRRAVPVPGVVAANGTVGGPDRRRLTGGGRVALVPARVTVDVPAGSPLAGLPLGGRRLGLAGRADVRLRAPVVLA